jgi:hypothetical protein
LTLKLACSTFGVYNEVETSLKRRNISIRKEITAFLSKIERLRFAISGDCFDTKIGVRYVRRLEWSRKGV